MGLTMGSWCLTMGMGCLERYDFQGIPSSIGDKIRLIVMISDGGTFSEVNFIGSMMPWLGGWAKTIQNPVKMKGTSAGNT